MLNLARIRLSVSAAMLGALVAVVPAAELMANQSVDKRVARKINKFNSDIARGKGLAKTHGLQSVQWDGRTIHLIATTSDPNILADSRKSPKKVKSFLEWFGTVALTDNFCKLLDRPLIASGVSARMSFRAPNGKLLHQEDLSEC